MTTDLINIVLLLVIIWLVAGIRQTLGAPSMGMTIRRAAMAVKTATTPRKDKADAVVPLDEADPSGLAEALDKMHGGKQ